MANVCRVGSKTLDFTREFYSLVKSLESLDETEMKQKYLEELKILKTKYSSDISEEDFFNFVRDIINNSDDILDVVEDNEKLSKILSQNYNGELSNYDPNFVESTLDNESKFDKIDSTPQENNDANALKESIIAQYFPMASDARLAFELRFKNGLIKSLFFNDVDEDNPRMNVNNIDMDKSIKQFRKNLASYLDLYVQKYIPENYKGFKQKTIENKLAFFKNFIESPRFSINSIELIKIPVYDTLQEGNLKDKLQAYMAYIALSNFDDMVATSFGDSVDIRYKNNYRTGEIKYRINLGNRNAQGWSDQNEDVDETEEIGGIIRLFMESLDMYNVDNGEMLPFKMSFSDVKSGLGGIMNLFVNSNEIGLIRNIKPHSYLLNLKENLEKTGIQNFYEKGWDKIYDKYVRNATLGQLIAQTKVKPSLLMPLLFTILATNSNQFFKNRYQEKQAVYSMWQNLFNVGNDNSLIRRTMNTGGINIDDLDLYSFFATLFVNIENIPVIEYRKDEDEISVASLRQNTASSKLNSQKYIWAANYNAEYPQQFKSFTIDDFSKDSNSTNVRIIKSDVILNLSSSGGNVIVIPKLSNGKNVNLNTFTPELQEFLSEVLGEKIDLDYYKLFTSLGGTLKDLLDIAGTILYNYKVGKTIRNIINNNSSEESERKIYDDNLKTYYPEEAPNMMRGSMQPELTTKSIVPKIRTFSLALDIQQGYSRDTTAKDGQGKQVSLLGLSSLDSKYQELFYNHNLENPNSILTGFNIYNSFEQVEFMRDYSGIDNKKQATTFSEAEFFEANFLYDFYGEQVAISDTGAYSDLRKNNTKGTSKFRIMGPVVSDKPKLPKLRFDWRSMVTLPDGTNEKRYIDLTTNDIYDIQQKEFGNYYQKVYTRIHQDWDNLQPYIQQIFDQQFRENSPIIVIDYDYDFEQFRNICTNHEVNPEEIIHEAIVNAQKDARLKGERDDSIKIIEGIHYLKGFHNNPALFHQLSIYGKPVPFKVSEDVLSNMDTSTISETPEHARERLNLQFISELLQNDIVLRIGSKDSNVKDAATWAAELFNEEGVWRIDKDIVIAKINNGENFVKNIFSSRDFQNWKEYQKLVSFYDSLPEKFDISNPKFELGSTLQAINILKKYNLFRFSNAQDILLKDYLEKGQKESIDKIIEEELRKKNPNWKDETIKKHVQQTISSMSEEEIKIKKSKYKLNKDIDQAIIKEIEGKTSKTFNYKKNLQTVNSYLESQPEYSNDAIKDIEKNIKELNEKLRQAKNPEEKEKIIQDLQQAKSIINISKMRKRLQGVEFNIQLNPEIERYHALNNWLGEAFQLTTVGTFIAHPGNNKASTIYNYEYRNFGQQVKRNVSHTATKHREMQNSLKGIRSRIRIAIITDAEDSYITFKGDYGTDLETHNGATFYNGTMVNLDNNSLGADAMGQDKKPFIHAIDPETGIGIIIKTAGFAVANSYIQKSPEAFGRINRKMNDTIKWTETLRRYGYNESYFDWLHDFNGNRLSFVSNSENGWYVQRNGRFYKFYNPNIDSNGNTRIRVQEVYSNGEPVNKTPYIVKFGYIGNKFIPVIESKSGAMTLDGKQITGDILFKPIDSNWELWNIFGGAYSCHFDSNHKLTYVNDENSFKMVNYVMNHTGKVIDEDIPKWDQSNIIQIVKESQIDMMPTTEAVKFGPGNINDVKKVFSDDSYTLTYMEVFSDDMGEQLDAEHTAEGGHVSLMTQVINALGARGYSTNEAEECYRALELLAEQSFEEAFDTLQQQNNSPEYRETFKTAIANIMLQTLKNTSISDGNILSAIAQGLKRFQKFGDYNQLEGSFPISSPQIYANLFSKLASTLEKASVRLKFEGGMLVLNPSNGIYQIINGKLLGNISEQEVRDLQSNAINNPIRNSSEIQFGHRYYIISRDENTEKINISDPILIDKIDDFYKVKNSLENSIVVEAFVENITIDEEGNIGIGGEYKPIGRDLATYGCTIKESNSDRTFSLWELDVIKQQFSWDKERKRFNLTKNPNVTPTALEVLWNRYHSGEKEITESLLNDFSRFATSEQLNKLSQFSTVEEALLYELNRIGIKEINPDKMHSYLKAVFQNTLNSISSGIGKSVVIDGRIKSSVIINGETINIDKSGTTVSPYEAIFPMIYKTTFGLKENDDIGVIEQDKYFFLKRFVENSKSKFYSLANGEYSVNGDEFDLELKKTSGNHIYIAHTSRDMSLNESIQIQTEVIDGVLYRMIDGKKAYPIPSKINKRTGQLVENCKFYKAFNGIEIIQTDDILTILDSEKYNSISFGDFSETSDKDLQNIFEQLEQSSNKVAKNKAQYIINAVTKKVNTNRKEIQKGNRLYTDAIREESLQNEYLNSPEKFNNIAEIFNNKASLNALHNHELYTRDASNQQNLLIELVTSLDNPKLLEEFLKEHPHMQSVLDFGLKQHTSFLTSLQAVVSRTPAQSHQSFMAMKVAGFDSNITNSIYVSRMQLYLQGSDFDIDKDNVLGLKYDNGILYTWSPYFDLSSKERENESESLPFPSGKSILIKDNTERIPWDVIDKNYQKIETEDGQAFIDNNRNIIKVHIINKNTYSLEFIPNQENLNTNTYLLQHAIIKNFGKGTIISNGVLDENVFNIDKNGKYQGINIINDYNLYLQSLDLSMTGNKFNNLRNVGELIRTFTALREIPSHFQNYINIVNKHNTMFLKRDGTKDKKKDKIKRNALYNFISIKTKNISRDPINLIQGQSGIDVATEEIKKLVKPGGKFDKLSSIPITSDHRSILARMHQLVLTLTGKQNVGIVASAMKVFEAMSHHYYKVLANGTVEEQERLLSNIKIMGKRYALIANSFVKNEDTILSDDVLKAYREVNNVQDAFIMMSALLSLATDNAKDPTLSKLNATPQTLGCYTAGLVLGLTIEEVADLLISDTGLLLTKMLQGNVFNPSNNQFKNLSEAISFIRNIPEIPKSVNLSEYYEMFGIKTNESGDIDEDLPGNGLRSSRGRQKFKRMAMFILYSDKFEFETEESKLAKRTLKEINNDPLYWGWNKESEEELNNSKGKKKERLEKQFKEHQRLVELKKSYEAYLDNPESYDAYKAREDLKEQINLIEKLSSESNKQKLKDLRNSTLEIKESLQSVFEWIRYREIVENDKISNESKEFSRLEQIRKLNSFNEEMGDLRTILKLNQGLPNSVQDQLSWINNFKGLLSRAARRQNRQIKDDSDTPLSTFNTKYGSLDLDLNRFLNDIEYQQDAIRAYENTKIGVNILDVMLDVPHYTGYMKTMNLLYEGGKAVSKNYDTQATLVKDILPQLSLKSVEQTNQFFKTLNPVIFERVNNNFLWQQQEEYEIPKFKIINGELKEYRDEKGNLQYESIRLGTKQANDKFKDYCVYYVYQYLKDNYPNNAFVKAISLRTYGYNLDHSITRNIAKRNSYNLTNPQSNAQFNEVKKALGELNGVKGLIKALYYYNLIAYNNQPGVQSLTDLFEDFLVYDTNDVISEYNKYITYIDESNIKLFEKSDEDYLLRVFAPKIYFFTDNIYGLKYFWIANPENNKDILMEVVGEPSEEEKGFLLENEDSENRSNGWVDDNDYNSYSKYKSYKTLEEVKKQLNVKAKLLKKEVKEADSFVGNSSSNSKRFVLGRELLNNSEQLLDIISSEYKRKTWSELSTNKKNEILKKYSKDIFLSVNGKNISLLDTIKLAESNGWTEQDVLNGFLFVSRKSKNHKYDTLVFSTLKTTLDSITKPNC